MLRLRALLDRANDAIRGVPNAKMLHQEERTTKLDVLLDDVGLVEHVELIGRVLSSEEHNGLLTSRMVREELGHVKDLAIDDDPTVSFLVVFGNFSPSVHLQKLSKWKESKQ